MSKSARQKSDWNSSIRLRSGKGVDRRKRARSFRRQGVPGSERRCMVAASLIDTNVLVYRFDPRFPKKQAIATQLLSERFEHGFDSHSAPGRARIYGGRELGSESAPNLSYAS